MISEEEVRSNLNNEILRLKRDFQEEIRDFEHFRSLQNGKTSILRHLKDVWNEKWKEAEELVKVDVPNLITKQLVFARLVIRLVDEEDFILRHLTEFETIRPRIIDKYLITHVNEGNIIFYKNSGGGALNTKLREVIRENSALLKEEYLVRLEANLDKQLQFFRKSNAWIAINKNDQLMDYLDEERILAERIEDVMRAILVKVNGVITEFRPLNNFGTRQVISKNGIPVQITISRNKVNGEEVELVSLCIGEITTLGKAIRGLREKEWAHFNRRKHLKELIENRILKRLKEESPDLWHAITGSYKWLSIEDVSKAEELKHQAELHLEELRRKEMEDSYEGKELSEGEVARLAQELEKAKEISYNFAASQFPGDIPVGTRATLNFYIIKPDSCLDLIEKARHPDESKAEKFKRLIGYIRTQQLIAYIPLIEVMPVYRKAGYARALLDVASWEIEKNRKLNVTYAIVEDKNMDYQYRMVGLFIKSGYNAFRVEEDIWNKIPGHILVVNTTNPNYRGINSEHVDWLLSQGYISV